MDHPTPIASIATLMERMANLTAQREQDELERALLAMLFDYLPCRHILLYAVRDADSVPHSRLLQQMPATGNGDAHAWQRADGELRQALERARHDRGPWLQHDTTWRVIFQKNTASAALVLRHDGLNDSQLSFLAGIVRIHENYLKLLYDAERDMLTGLLNRRTFDARLYELLEGGSRQHTLALVDIDHFKHVNDRFGHIVGDEILLLVARLLVETLGSSARCYRYGGEEFGVILEPAPEPAAVQLEQLRQAIADFVFPQLGSLTISIGHVPIDGQALPANAVGQADRALYHAKEHGRNRVVSYTSLLQRGQLDLDQRHEGEIELF